MLVLLGVAGCSREPGARPPQALADAETELIERLFASGLFDPAGATRSHGTVSVRNCFGRPEVKDLPGWLVPASGKDGARFILDTLQETSPPDRPEPVDIEADALRRLESGTAIDRAIWAAWLHRLGRTDGAARLLRRALAGLKAEDLEKSFRSHLAWQLFDQAVNAFRDRADGVALRSVERLVELGGDFVEPANCLLSDLRRRRAEGTFGKPPPPLPDDFSNWPVERRVAKLIELLDEVNAPQPGSPGDVEFDRDPRFIDVCDEGEAAVPALIACLETDARLIRSFGYFRSYLRGRDLLDVRGTAYRALRVILKTKFTRRFENPADFDLETEDGVKKAAAHIRSYWEKYGGMSFPARMMAVLADEKATPFAWQEAAENLGRLRRRRSHTMDRWIEVNLRARSGLLSELAAFKDPTAAEAVLAAFDRNVAAFAVRGKEAAFYGLDWLEERYLDAVARIGDPRILPRLKLRYEGAKSVGLRRNLAWCMHRLGDSGAMDDFARAFERGRLVLPANDRKEVAGNMPGVFQPGNLELRRIVGTLGRAGTRAAEEALEALTRTDHPQHSMAAERVRTCDPGWTEDRDWFAHPYCLKILRRGLENRAATGVTLSVERGRVVWRAGDSSGEQDLPDLIGNPGDRKDRAEGRWCDAVAQQLNRLVVGLPEYHPLMKDPDPVLGEMARILDRFEGRFRLLKEPEIDALGLDRSHSHFVPDLKPLRAKATEEDVAAGRAVFSSREPTTPGAIRLPAAASVKGVRGRMLVLQAERRADDTIRLGGIAPFGFRSFEGEDLEALLPLVESDR